MNKIYQHNNNSHRSNAAQGSAGAGASSNRVGPPSSAAAPSNSQQQQTNVPNSSSSNNNNNNNHGHHLSQQQQSSLPPPQWITAPHLPQSYQQQHHPPQAPSQYQQPAPPQPSSLTHQSLPQPLQSQQYLGSRFNVDEWLKSINAWDEKYDFVMHNNHWLTSNYYPDCEKCNLHDQDLINLNETFDLYKSALEESQAPLREMDLMASSRIPRIPVRSIRN